MEFPALVELVYNKVILKKFEEIELLVFSPTMGIISSITR